MEEFLCLCWLLCMNFILEIFPCMNSFSEKKQQNDYFVLTEW